MPVIVESATYPMVTARPTGSCVQRIYRPTSVGNVDFCPTILHTTQHSSAVATVLSQLNVDTAPRMRSARRWFRFTQLGGAAERSGAVPERYGARAAGNGVHATMRGPYERWSLTRAGI